MTSHQNCRCARIFLHGLIHALLQILLERSVLNDRHHQLFVVAQISLQSVIINALQSTKTPSKLVFSSNVFSVYTLIISKCVQRNSLPGHKSVAMTAFGECV